jgi:hypothetical protein
MVRGMVAGGLMIPILDRSVGIEPLKESFVVGKAPMVFD